MDKKACTGYCQTSPDAHPDVMTHLRGTKPYPLTVYFDGDCPICRREIDLMKIFNRKKHLEFIDFSTSSYLPAEHGLSPCDLGKVIHARWSDGTLIRGVEVFREMWEAIGLRSLARLARRPTIHKLLVRAYDWFARNRLRLTGRAGPGSSRPDFR